MIYGTLIITCFASVIFNDVFEVAMQFKGVNFTFVILMKKDWNVFASEAVIT